MRRSDKSDKLREQNLKISLVAELYTSAVFLDPEQLARPIDHGATAIVLFTVRGRASRQSLSVECADS
eukprot:5644780-Amphidinium_carterae.1